MSFASGYSSDSEFVWISPRAQMPSVCCTCGMFADDRTVIRHVELERTEPGSDESSAANVLIAIVLHLFLGPIGWLLTAFAEKDARSKIVKRKSKIRISQCRLCKGQHPPEVIDFQNKPPLFMFAVHREFKRRFDLENSGNSLEPSEQA